MNGFEAESEIERLLLQVCIVMEILNLYFLFLFLEKYGKEMY